MNDNEQIIVDNIRLGKLPAKSSMKALHLSDFTKTEVPLPAATHFWKKRAPFALRTFGNTEFGCCTRAKQAIAAMRMERLETRNTPEIADQEIIRVYTDMSNRLYGGGDNGAYELDALGEWRKPDLTFRDTKGRPLTIDAFLKINHTNTDEIKRAIHTSAAHGIAICFNLPLAFASMTRKWEIPKGQPLLGEWMAGSWGGHSMTADEFSEFGIRHPTTWGMPDIWISWDAVAAYCDEAFLFIDSINSWRKRGADKFLNLPAIKEAVNSVSSHRIK